MCPFPDSYESQILSVPTDALQVLPSHDKVANSSKTEKLFVSTVRLPTPLVLVSGYVVIQISYGNHSGASAPPSYLA